MSCLGPIHRAQVRMGYRPAAAQARCRGRRHARVQQLGAPGFWPLHCTLGGFGTRALMVRGQFEARVHQDEGEGEPA